MPVWTLKELQAARELCFPHVPAKDVENGYNKYGGVARHVLEYPPEKSRANYEFQLNSLSPEMVERIMSAANYESLPSFNNVGYLIHVLPGKDPGHFRCAFASRQAFRDIVRRFQRLSMFKARQFAEILRLKHELGGLYGIFLEELAHRYLSQGGEEYPVFELLENPPKRTATATGPKTHQVKWPAFRDNTVIFDHISGLERVESGTYYRPSSKTYETIDSFVLFEDGSFLDSKLSGPILVLIQITVSDSHIVNGAKVSEVFRDVSKKWKGDEASDGSKAGKKPKPLSCVLVFATRKYPKGVRTFQRPKKADNGEYQVGHAPKVAEYSLVLERDFEEVWLEVDALDAKERGVVGAS